MIGLKENSQKTDRKGTGIMKENRYELNKQLAQMLKGGVIMDCNNSGAGQRSQKKQVHVQSWHWKESRQISAQQAVYPV